MEQASLARNVRMDRLVYSAELGTQGGNSFQCGYASLTWLTCGSACTGVANQEPYGGLLHVLLYDRPQVKASHAIEPVSQCLHVSSSELAHSERCLAHGGSVCSWPGCAQLLP